MNQILVVPSGGQVLLDHSSRSIRLPELQEFAQMDAKQARTRASDDDREHFQAQYHRSQEKGVIANLAKRRHVRLGCGVGFRFNGEPCFGKFTDDHPTSPGLITPPSGIFEQGHPHDTALKELAEEMVIRNQTVVGVWNYEDRSLIGWNEDYAKTHGLVFDPYANFGLVRTDSVSHWNVYFGSEKHRVLVDFDAATSAIELLWTLDASAPDNTWSIVDGEKLPKGEWRHNPIVRDSYDKYPQTGKAQVMIRVHEHDLHPV